jgi:2-hydroxychromene-2-carboxylate isomerase
VELARWRDHLGVPINIAPKYFPFAPGASVKAVIAADIVKGPAAAMRLAHALMHGCWVQDRNVGDPETVSAIVREQDLDSAALGEVAVAADAQAKYELYTEEATARGVFGAPSYVVGDEIFWGQDSRVPGREARHDAPSPAASSSRSPAAITTYRRRTRCKCRGGSASR